MLIKRFFDLLSSIAGLILTLPIVIVAMLLIVFTSKGSPLYFQTRIGYKGKPFNIIKLRTMVISEGDSTVTTLNDIRITSVGKVLRKLKIDELPQLINVLIGDMSIVGPRPDVPGYADKLKGDDRIILTVRPGITGPASLYFRDEEVLLSKQENPKEYNDNVIWPQKIAMNKKYVEDWSFKMDLIYLIKTVFRNA